MRTSLSEMETNSVRFSTVASGVIAANIRRITGAKLKPFQALKKPFEAA